MNREIISTYEEYDENGNIKSRTVTRSPYTETEHRKLTLDEVPNRHCASCENRDDCEDEYDEFEDVYADLDDDDYVYFVTPKGLACMAAVENGLTDAIDDPRLDAFWAQFKTDMARFNYALEEM